MGISLSFHHFYKTMHWAETSYPLPSNSKNGEDRTVFIPSAPVSQFRQWISFWKRLGNFKWPAKRVYFSGTDFLNQSYHVALIRIIYSFNRYLLSVGWRRSETGGKAREGHVRPEEEVCLEASAPAVREGKVVGNDVGQEPGSAWASPWTNWNLIDRGSTGICII